MEDLLLRIACPTFGTFDSIFDQVEFKFETSSTMATPPVQKTTEPVLPSLPEDIVPT